MCYVLPLLNRFTTFQLIHNLIGERTASQLDILISFLKEGCKLTPPCDQVSNLNKYLIWIVNILHSGETLHKHDCKCHKKNKKRVNQPFNNLIIKDFGKICDYHIHEGETPFRQIHFF